MLPAGQRLAAHNFKLNLAFSLEKRAFEFTNVYCFFFSPKRVNVTLDDAVLFWLLLLNFNFVLFLKTGPFTIMFLQDSLKIQLL